MEDPSPNDSGTADHREIAVYTRGKVLVGTYLGGPLVGTFMLARNFAALGHPRAVRLTWILGILGSLVVFGGLMFLPLSLVNAIPTFLIPLIYTLGVAAVFEAHRERVEAHVAADGASASGWRVAGIAALGVVVSLALLVLFAPTAPLMEGERLTVGRLEHEVFYEPPVTEAEARAVGEVMNDIGFRELDFVTYMKIEARTDGGYRVLFPVEQGVWEDADAVQWYRSLRPELGAVLSGADVSVVLFYEGFDGREEHPI